MNEQLEESGRATISHYFDIWHFVKVSSFFVVLFHLLNPDTLYSDPEAHFSKTVTTLPVHFEEKT